MKDNYELKTCDGRFVELPNKDCSDNDVWEYALSFSGYTWTIDMHKEGQLIPILSQESIEFLDKHDGNWRDPDSASAVLLTSCIGSGRSADECSIEELRTSLWMEQRATRNSANWAHGDGAEEAEWAKTSYARELIEEIRKKS